MNNVEIRIFPNEIKAKIAYLGTASGTECSIEGSVEKSLIEREAASLEPKQIAAAALQFLVQRDGIFVAGNPKLKIENPSSDTFQFSAIFPILEKPVLNAEQLVEELKNSLHEDDLESVEECKKRLISIIESRITYSFPKEFLVSVSNPVEAITIWKKSIALASLADLIKDDNQSSMSRDQKSDAAIQWILKHAIEVKS